MKASCCLTCANMRNSKRCASLARTAWREASWRRPLIPRIRCTYPTRAPPASAWSLCTAQPAVAVLPIMGFRNVLNLDGGFARWDDEGIPEMHEDSY